MGAAVVLADRKEAAEYNNPQKKKRYFVKKTHHSEALELQRFVPQQCENEQEPTTRQLLDMEEERNQNTETLDQRTLG